jgi:hypothetical protein
MRELTRSILLIVIVSSSSGLQARRSAAEKPVEHDIARARAATARFRVVSEALAAGYIATAQCVQDPRRGAMGLHYKHPALRDGTVDLEHPEILLYVKMPDGELRLTGVEYVVPLSAWTDDQPPMLMGQRFRREEQVGIWYLHAWLWEENPSGMFADFNPRLTC